MATITKVGTPSLTTPTPCSAHRVGSGLLAGEAIGAGDPCYIKSDGTVWKSNGTSANAAAEVDGFAGADASAGEPVSLYTDVEFRYGSGLTPGTKIFVGTTAGLLVDAATTGGSKSVGRVVDATRIRVWQSRYA